MKQRNHSGFDCFSFTVIAFAVLYFGGRFLAGLIFNI